MGCDWKLTIVGGDLNGNEFSFPATAVILVGRTHTADIRIKELDVSGRHLELRTIDSAPTLVNITRNSVTRLNGVEVTTGCTCPVSRGDVIEVGGKVRVRVDSVPSQDPPQPESQTSTGTLATQWMSGGAMATDVPTADIIEETAFSGTEATRFKNQDDGAVMEASQTHADVAADAMTTRTRLPGAAVALGGASSEPAAAELKLETSNDALFAAEGETTAVEGSRTNASEDVKTIAAVTQAAPAEVLDQLREELNRKSKRRKAGLVFALAMFAAFLSALWFVSRPNNEADRMIFPLGADGKPDAAYYKICDDQGKVFVKVDYPNNPKADVLVSPDSNGVSVVSYMGRDRDVPFFLNLETISSAEELSCDLISSVQAWLRKKEESGLGFVFDEKMKYELRPQFFEDEYPGCCESPEGLYGVRFVQFEYKRTWPDNKLWHGVVIYFRRGDTAYVLRREIPEFYWVRGGKRLLDDPNIAVYSNFIDSYWESPGLSSLPIDQSIDDLMYEIRASLAKERASDWRFVKLYIGAVLVKTWRTDPKTRDVAMGCLRQFREVLRVHYWKNYNAYRTAKSNRDDKRMLKYKLDANAVFNDRSERYYYLIGNGEVW